MRHFIVKHFALSHKFEARLIRLFSYNFFLPVGIACFFGGDMLYGFSSLGIAFLLYFLPIGKKQPWIIARAPRIIMPYFFFMTIVFGVTDTIHNDLSWYHYVLLAIFAVLCWISFGGYKIGYFDIWPVKREELDEEQKMFYDKAMKILN